MRTAGRNRKREDKRKQHISRVKYAACVTGLLLLIAAAFWMPQAVFAAQSYYQGRHMVMEETMGEREISRLGIGYEYDVRTRMEEFVQGIVAGRQYYAIASDYELDEAEQEEILRILVTDVGVKYTNEMTLGYVEMGFNDFVFEESKMYVITDKKFESGIAFSCLYLELSNSWYKRIQILMDMEDHTIYFMRAILPGKQMAKWPELPAYLAEFDNYLSLVDVSYHYGQYYYADAPADGSVDGGRAAWIEQEQKEGFYRLIGENYYDYTVPICYEENFLHMDFMVHFGDLETRADAGLREIAELIPEFAADPLPVWNL